MAPAYDSTIRKIQGQTLGKIVLWLDWPVAPQGEVYVACLAYRH